MPTIKERAKLLDPWRPLIASWLEGDWLSWRKRRHAAHRVWVRLREEGGRRVRGVDGAAVRPGAEGGARALRR